MEALENILAILDAIHRYTLAVSLGLITLDEWAHAITVAIRGLVYWLTK